MNSYLVKDKLDPQLFTQTRIAAIIHSPLTCKYTFPYGTRKTRKIALKSGQNQLIPCFGYETILNISAFFSTRDVINIQKEKTATIEFTFFLLEFLAQLFFF